MNKKGQASQVFLYITAAVVFALIVIFGYQSITWVTDRGEQVAYTRFKEDLQQAIYDIHSDYGSVRVYNTQNTLRVPGKYEQVCFIEAENPPDKEDCPSDLNPIICDTWKDLGSWEEADQNVFLKPSGPSSIKVHKIKIKGDNKHHLCFNTTNNLLNMRLKGQGDQTLISKP